MSLTLARAIWYSKSADANGCLRRRIHSCHAFHAHALSDAFCLIAVFTDHVNLQLNRGAELPDPKKKLVGTGRLMRHIKVEDWDDLNQPHLREFLRAALKHADYKKAVKQGGEEMNRTIVQKFEGAKRRPGAAEE